MENRLRVLLDSFNHKETFKPGDIVRWKPGMKHKRTEGPFIVVEILDPPIFDTDKDSGSTYFREPLDIILGSMDRDHDFVLYHFDSRRFTKVD